MTTSQYWAYEVSTEKQFLPAVNTFFCL